MRFCNTYTNAIEDFLLTPDALLNARLTCEVTDLVTLERYLRAIAYYLWKTSPNYELVFSHTYSYYAEPLVSFTNSTDQLLVQIVILLTHVSHKLMSLISIQSVPVPVDTDMYIGNSHKNIQLHVQPNEASLSERVLHTSQATSIYRGLHSIPMQPFAQGLHTTSKQLPFQRGVVCSHMKPPFQMGLCTTPMQPPFIGDCM